MQRVPSAQRRRLKKRVGEWRCATWNIGTMTGRSREIAETMKQRKEKILYVQEVRWRGGGGREIGECYKLYYSGSRTGRNGVGIILDEELKQRVVYIVQKPSDRLMTIKVLAGKSLINIVSGYAPQFGCEDQEKKEFREQLEQSVREIPEEEEIILGAELSYRRNSRSGDSSSQIDFLVVKKRTRKNVRDAKVIPGEEVAYQHKLLVMDGTFSKKRIGETTEKKLQNFKVWKLRECAGEYRRERMGRANRTTSSGKSDTASKPAGGVSCP
ncbi:craniofacial development protein 2-like [Penaeus indicus]|uniref:craniofacial development protein 2-like n=1 Tax=Penaeus indicus TaxID=29960 RepID=UPI00300D9CF7